LGLFNSGATGSSNTAELRVAGSSPDRLLEQAVAWAAFASNAAPAAADDATAVSHYGGEISVLINDADPDKDPLTVSGVTQGANGQRSRETARQSATRRSRDSSAATPSTYTVIDGHGAPPLAVVSVTVLPNRTPTTVNELITGQSEYSDCDQRARERCGPGRGRADHYNDHTGVKRLSCNQ